MGLSELYDYAYCPQYVIEYLKGMCLPEKWSFGDRDDNSILKSYLEHTFRKIREEGKLYETDSYAVFHTGLFTKKYQEIYAYFEININPGAQKWYLKGFYTKYDLNKNIDRNNLPGRANYFEDPALLVFNTNYDIEPQFDHILDNPENKERIPENLRDKPYNLRALFEGAIKQAKHMIDANYKTAVPQYYNGGIQLLIPICLHDEQKPDLALVVSKGEGVYYGHTCLTLEMAYNNARLIARPDSSWLAP